MFKSKGEIKKQDMSFPAEAQVAVAQAEKTEARQEPKKAPGKKRPAHILLIAGAVFLICLGAVASVYFGQWEGGAIAMEELTAVSINLNINSRPEIVNTNVETVGELLKEQRILLGVDDYIGLDVDQPLSNGMTIWLRLSVPISVTADGQTQIINSQPITVEQALRMAGITLDADDECSLPLLQYIYEDTEISVYRMMTREETVDEAIPPPVAEREFTYLAPGSSEVISPGRDGISRNTYDVTYRDGVETERILLKQETISEPGEKIIGYGPETDDIYQMMSYTTADGEELKTATTENGATFYYTNSYIIETTAYTWTGNRTATGTWPQVGTIAVDPSVIPLGTKGYIVGYGFVTAEDTGGAVKGNIVDLYMDTESQCILWGRRNAVMYVLPE